MDINKNQSELIVQSLGLAIWEMRTTTNDIMRFPNAYKTLDRDIEELDKIINVIKGKEFSIVLKE